jgi:protein-S-isoprenylcysteine O-methyltransferase Ste14
VKTIRVLAANIGLSAMMIVAAVLVLSSDRLWPFRLPEFLVPAFWPLLAIGTLMITSAVATFARVAHATGAAGDAPTRLVTSGPFRYSRNPIYVGVGLLLLAVAFFRSSPSFLLLALLFVAGIDAYVRRVEEPRLEQRFGEEYALYKKAVPRWMPRWPGRGGVA